MRYPNQISVIIDKDENFKDASKTAWYHVEAMSQAYKNLTKSAFALWLYIARNQNGYRLELSYVAFNKMFDVSERSYRDAKLELIEKGYMILVKKDIYKFYEYAQEVKLTASDF